MMDVELKAVRDWAKEKIQDGSEPPWAWYQYMKLVETIDAILAGKEAAEPIHLAVDNDEVQLPM